MAPDDSLFFTETPYKETEVQSHLFKTYLFPECNPCMHLNKHLLAFSLVGLCLVVRFHPIYQPNYQVRSTHIDPSYQVLLSLI